MPFDYSTLTQNVPPGTGNPSADNTKNTLALLDLDGRVTDHEDRLSSVESSVGGAVQAGYEQRSIPAGYWGLPEWPNPVVMVSDQGGDSAHGYLDKDHLQAFALYSQAYINPASTFYVNIATGLDTNAGTEASPIQSYGKALALVNAASGTTAKVVTQTGGNATRALNFNSLGTGVLPNKDVAWVFLEPTVIGTFDAYAAPSVDATFTNCYSMARSNVDRVINLRGRDRYGKETELVYVPTAARCNITPDSWSDNGGNTTLYVNRADGLAVTAANTRVLLGIANLQWFWTSSSPQKSQLFVGPVTFQGGNGVQIGPNIAFPNGADLATATAYRTAVLAGGRDAVIFGPGVTSNFAGGRTSGPTSNYGPAGFAIEGLYGLAAIFGGNAGGSETDGWNVHNVVGQGFYGAWGLDVNFNGQDNGRSPGLSCQAKTYHDGLKYISVCLRGMGSHGGAIRCISGSKGIAFSPRLGDLGDVVHGGQIMPVGARTDDSGTELTLDRPKVIGQPAGSYSWFAGPGSTIIVIDPWPDACVKGGTGTVTVTAS